MDNIDIKENLQYLNNVVSLQADTNGGIKRIRRKLILMKKFWTTDRFGNGNQKVMCMPVDWRKGLKKNMAIL